MRKASYRGYRINLDQITDPAKRMHYIICIKRDFYRTLARNTKSPADRRAAYTKSLILQSILEEALTGIKNPTQTARNFLRCAD